MLLCDLNCDMGEETGNDELLMPYVTAANIACGFHAGNADTMRQTIGLALEHGVKIGAHPSFRDRAHFGRRPMRLPREELYDIIMEQLTELDAVARECGAALHHVKPHGALYNMAAGDAEMAHTVALAVKDFNDALVLYGMSGSLMIGAAVALRLRTASEVFADRTYTGDGRLTPRDLPHALIESEGEALAQVLQMVKEGTVTTTTGGTLPILAETVCIHGDGRRALSLARTLHTHLQQDNIAS